MSHNTTVERQSSTPTRRQSTPAEQAEFLSLVRALGAEPKQRQGWQPVRCWNRAAHSHGDRTPSLSVNLETCWFRCHGCGIHGGLTKARSLTGRERVPHVSRVPLHEITRCADFDVDPLQRIPRAEIDALRARTGRHKLDRALTRNLRLLLATAVQRFDETGKATGVRFTSADALEAGIRPQTFTDLVRLLPWFGINVKVGESGRKFAREAVKRERVHLKATLIERMEAKTYYSVKVSGTSYYPHEGSTTKMPRPEAVIAANLASKAVPDENGLARSPAVADLITDLATVETVLPVSDGRFHKPGSRTIEELVKAHGDNVRRTIRKAESAGLVVVVRMATHGSGARAGFVSLTETGAEVLQRDIDNGRERQATRATQIRENWAKAQERFVSVLGGAPLRQGSMK